MSDRCFVEFNDLAVKYSPPEALAAAISVCALAHCFMHDSVTEAVDASRALAPELERAIRAYFPRVMDKKMAYLEARKAKQASP